MEEKTGRNIFESDFESFELDDGFLLTIDADLSKHKINIKDSSAADKLNPLTVSKPEVILEENKVDGSKKHSQDISIFLEDLNESDFFEKSSSKNKKNFLKVTNTTQKLEENAEVHNKKDTCLSPILLLKSKNKLNRTFSSTPLRRNSNKSSERKNGGKSEENKEAEKPEENIQEIPDCEFLETDLFDDWNIEGNSQKDSITLSQAFKLIEEAESAKEANKKEDLNTSIDLLTGRPVRGDVEDLFAESFSLPNFVKSKEEESSDDCIINSEESDFENKFSGVQKVHYKTKTEAEKRKKNFVNDSNSDDDFDFLTQELLKKPKCAKSLTELKGFDSDDSSENIMRKGKYCRIIESDSADDDSDSKLNKSHSKKKIRKVKNFKKNAAREFIETEAEVSDLIIVSSDESEEEGSYDASFVDEELYLTQNCSANMTAKYLESIKSPYHPGRFKIPEKKSYSSPYVFSQIPEDNNTEYELDSFCVNEVEEEMKTELSDLEIAEKILEMDRKKRKRSKFFKNQ